MKAQASRLLGQDALCEVVLLLGLGVELVRGDAPVGFDAFDHRCCFEPEKVIFSALKMRISFLFLWGKITEKLICTQIGAGSALP